MNLYYKYISSKIIFLQNKCTYTAYQYWGKASKIFHTFCVYLWLPSIMNLISCTVRLENFMTSCRDKLYHLAISNKIKFSFLIILFGKNLHQQICLHLALTQIRLVTINCLTDKIKSSSCLWQQFCEWSGQQQWCSQKWCEW